MNRTIIILVILAALGVGGYFVFQAQNQAAEQAAVAEAAAAEAAAAAAAAAEAAAAEAAAAEAAAAEAAAVAAAAEAEAAALEELAAVFTAEGFDLDRAIAALNAADVPAMTRSAVITALTAARDTPDLLAAALEQARAALGLAQ